MGFFSELFGIDSTPKESPEVIESKINNSETSERFKNYFLENLSPGSEWCSYLLKDTRNHSIHMKFEKKGISIEFMNFDRRYFKANDTYVFKRIGIGFSASGFADLPNDDYVFAFKKYILNALQKNFTHLRIENNGPIVIHYNESARIGW